MTDWKQRAKKYNNLSWIKNKKYKNSILSSAKLNKSDVVLNVGVGTGTFADDIAKQVKKVIGIDISVDMLKENYWKDNKFFIQQDIRDPLFNTNTFDKIFARMVFHHILTGTQKAMDECYRVLKPKGIFIISEGVPPKASLKKDYQKIFKYKEKRLTFLPEDILRMMKKSGFKDIKVKECFIEDFSLNNWLDNCDVSKKNKQIIINLHKNGTAEFKKAYNLRKKGNDYLIRVKKVIITGVKR